LGALAAFEIITGEEPSKPERPIVVWGKRYPATLDYLRRLWSKMH